MMPYLHDNGKQGKSCLIQNSSSSHPLENIQVTPLRATLMPSSAVFISQISENLVFGDKHLIVCASSF